ncbi:TPA: hypothetical protein ACMVA2_000241 [Clostridioides difficile]|nr:hypothetical protein [Clostridioides difficile]MDS6381694.1 hypothetical protein [Clostridioides difficile]
MELDFRIWNGFRIMHEEELRLLTEEIFIKSDILNNIVTIFVYQE